MPNKNLQAAKTAKKNEFYTQFSDIQKEVNAYLEYNPDVFRDKTILLPCDDPEWSNFTRFFAQNFENFGLRKLISTSYAIESKQYKTEWQPTLFETKKPYYDIDKSKTHGKIFVLTHDTNQNGHIDIEDLEWEYLQGDGDFHSPEVCALRDEADIIVTNPPFSMFREFLAWIMEAGKKFLIIGNMNAIPYKEVFPLIKENKLWLGTNDVRWFYQGDVNSDLYEAAHSRWFTNLDHGRHHQPMELMTFADNIKFSKHKEVKGFGYLHYYNYDAIDIPHSDAIPSDYDGVMGVPISWLDKYCPEQFEILDCREPASELELLKKRPKFVEYKSRQIYVNGVLCQKSYHRLLIRKKQ